MLSRVLQKATRDARVEALSGFRKEVAGGSYPGTPKSPALQKPRLRNFARIPEAIALPSIDEHSDHGGAVTRIDQSGKMA
ncbi:hypothetical protein BQ8482_170041 [Mesorhizobium delmotii]|uniref:Uncharacterized protein n=1 Tax=Mesorhizobium delmotii TaxID=1631247 RepID=A0A2P9AHR9_9HYPH|nr:hypothetical protein BQ8482_170041 [Mesorhizobium delmotii]